MLRLLVLLCMVYFSVGNVIIGNVVLQGDGSSTANSLSGSILVVSIVDASMSDGPAREVASAQYSNLSSFPIAYQLTYNASDVSGSPSYSLRARITCPVALCYINDQNIPLPADEDGVSSVDIPVRAI